MISKRRRRGLYSTRGTGSIVSIVLNLGRVFVPLLVIAGVAYFALNFRSAGSGRLRVKTNIPGADILIGGMQTGLKSDTTITKLKAGRKIITVRRQDYVSEPEFMIVPIADDSITTVSFRLHPASESIQRSDSIPPLRSVRQEIFSTGEPILAIPPGSSRYAPLVDYSGSRRRPVESQREYSKPAPETNLEQISPEDIPADGPLTTESPVTDFQEEEAIQGTEVLVSSIPNGAKIWVNGGETERMTPYTFRGLDRGLYIIKVMTDGLISEPDCVLVRLDESYQRELASFNLEPDPSLPKPTLTVRTSPLAAGIKINSEPVGVGQATKELSYGTFQITFAEAPGFRTPEPMIVDLTKDQPHVELTGEYEKIIGTCYLAILPGEELEKFDPKLLKLYVDNELVLDGPDGKFNVTLVSKVVAGNRLIKVHYGELQKDLNLELVDGAVTELSFRVESFFSKRSLKLREKPAVPLDKWQERNRRLTVLNLG